MSLDVVCPGNGSDFWQGSFLHLNLIPGGAVS